MKKFNIFILFIHISITIVLVLVYISFTYQSKIKSDLNNGALTMSWEEVSKIPSFPNVGVTTMPISSFKALYKLVETDEDATDMLMKGSKANPYISYSEFILATYYLKNKRFDSAYVYAKKAFYNWPKNVKHYKLYNETLVAKKDTTEILMAYSYINDRFESKDEYYQNFIDSYSNAKLRFMIFDYVDLRSIDKAELMGEWKQMYEFEGGNINYLDKKIVFENDIFINNSTKYKYKLQNDTLALSFLNSEKVISQIPIFYSDSLQTLVLKNIPTSVIEDVPQLQDQFFKKIID